MASVCKNCNSTAFIRDHTTNETVCENCGSVVEENRIVSEVSFSEAANGKAIVTGQYVSHDQSGVLGNTLHGIQAGESRLQTINKAKHRMERIGHRLGMAEHIIEGGVRYFRLALAHNFVKGRKSQHVLSACLYLSCRMAKTDHMLMDFAELIHVNVFHIGTTFLQLVRKINVEKMPIVDPTIYVNRFIARLHFGDQGGPLVQKDAEKLVARMGKDWLSGGRRPAGVAAACILLAARMNNYRRSKAEIVQVAKIAEETLQRRLDEFKRTPAGTLSVHDFRHTDVDSAADPPSFTRHRELERKMEAKLRHDEELREQGVEPEDPYLDPEMIAMAKELDKQDGEILKLTKEVDAVLELDSLRKAAVEVAAEPRAIVKQRSSQDEDSGSDEDSENEDEEAEEAAESAFNEAVNAGTSDAAVLAESAHIAAPPPVEPPGQAASTSQDENISASSAIIKKSPEASNESREIFAPAAEANSGIASNISKAPPSESTEAETILGRAERFIQGYHRRCREQAQAAKEAQEERRAAAARAVVPDEESLSDMDDSEIESVLLNEEEIDFKSRVWLSINHEYLLNQERKRLRREAEIAAGLTRPAKKRRKPRPKLEPESSLTAEAGAAAVIREKAPSKKINQAALRKIFST